MSLEESEYFVTVEVGLRFLEDLVKYKNFSSENLLLCYEY